MQPLIKKQLKKYEERRICHICFKSFNGENPKVRDTATIPVAIEGPLI